MCGVQGAGKSYWIDRHAYAYAPCIRVDAALPGAIHSKPIIDIARRHNAEAHAIWIDVPMDIAKERNAQRPADQRVPHASIESAASLFEPPAVER
ncbi:AAA family ATPase [Burkholderia sp. Ac-20345]|uniref:AAA family ATPase n=1 Tax=Burkholderia sp. Ac-20345 TaxID=2703891 RepID=UPI003216A938